MRFEPKTDQQLAAEDTRSLLPPGTYDAEIVEAEEKVSAKGNDMIAARLRVFDNNGGTRTVRDWLMASMGRKLRNAAYAAGLRQEYDSGELLAADFVGKTCKVKIKVEQDRNGQYPDSNRVDDYIVAEGRSAGGGAGARAPTKFGAPREPQGWQPSPVENDDIPF